MLQLAGKKRLPLFSMRKIAMVIPKYGLVGGAEQFASELTARLYDRTKDEFHLFANRRKPDATPIRFHPVPVISFPKWLTTPSFAWFVRRGLRRNACDLVHSHERIFSADLFTMHGVPHRFWVREVRKKSMSLYDRATDWVEARMVHEGGCRKFVAVSELTKDIFLRHYPINPEKVCVIHPGVHLEAFSKKSKDTVRQAVRGNLGIEADVPLIVFASMNFEIKGLDDILAALSQVRKKGGRFKIVIAGKGNASKYQKIAARIGLSDAIVFTGALEKDKLIDLYLAADAYVMLSKFDTFGMVVLEAMAAGLPVIVSGNVGAKDLVREGENGFVVENPADHEKTAAKIALLLDGTVRRKMSEAALQTASENTWTQTAAKYLDIYHELLDAKMAQTPDLKKL